MSRDLIRYDCLENRIDQMKTRLYRLLDYYKIDMSGSIDEICDNEDDDDDSDEFKSINSSNWSLQTFHSVSNFDDVSINSFVTAIDKLEEREQLPEPNQGTSQSSTLLLSADNFSHSPKKFVTFNNNVAVYETRCLYPSVSKTKRISSRIKSKLTDFIEYEKFAFRYKWYKLKRGVQRLKQPPSDYISPNPDNDSGSYLQDDRLQLPGKSHHRNNNNVKTVDLFMFFTKYFESYLIETNVDNNQCNILYFQFPLQKTDLTFDPFSNTNPTKNTPTFHETVLDKNSNINNNEDDVNADDDDDESLIPNGDLNLNNDTKNSDNVLFKYLVLKAQSPIERQIATSVIKLSLPLWYQNSLIL